MRVADRAHGALGDWIEGGRGLAVVGFGALLAGVLVFSVFLFGTGFSGYDWHDNFHYYDWIRTGLTQHGVFPLFMADAVHSQDLLAEPQSPLLSPLVWLLLFVSAQTYIKLLITEYATVKRERGYLLTQFRR